MPYSKHLPKVLTEEDLTIITNTILNSQSYIPSSVGDWLKWRDISIIQFGFYTGLRPQELLQLRWDDILFEKKLIKVIPYMNHKRKNDMKAVLTPPSEQIISRWKEKCITFSFQCEYIFPSLFTMKPMATCTMERRFKSIVDEAGLNSIERRDARGKPTYTYSLYSLRHSFLTLVYKKTRDTTIVSKLARHLRPESAFTYIHLCDEERVEMAEGVFS